MIELGSDKKESKSKMTPLLLGTEKEFCITTIVFKRQLVVKSAFEYKASVSVGSASVPADFPAVFFHISHWHLSWNTFDKSTSQESVEKGNQLH